MVGLEKLEDPTDIAEVRAMIERHAEYTGSERARRILKLWEEMVTKFVKVTLQNRSPHNETITSFAGLVTLVAESLATNCPNAAVTLHAWGRSTKEAPL